MLKKIKYILSTSKYAHEYFHWLLSYKTDRSKFVPYTKTLFQRKKTDVKIFAHYLPQFYPIPENDFCFGKGFTEWRNVATCQPYFIGHEQPKLPYDLGFYTLTDISVIQRQVEIAKTYGIYGFCFYYYWYSGKKLLDKPLQIFLNSNIDFPFHLCWCNHDWTQLWDNGEDNKKLLEAHIIPEEAEEFFNDILPFIQDSRYEKIDEKPILMIFNTHQEKTKDFLSKLNKLALQNGFKGFYFIGGTFHKSNPLTSGCHAAMEWGITLNQFHLKDKCLQVEKKLISDKLKFRIYDMVDFIRKKEYLYPVNYPLFKCCFPSWDNTPRKALQNGYVFLLEPDDFQQWLDDCIIWTKLNHYPAERYMYIFAWNEWAEGAMLEPTIYRGYQYLNIVKQVLEKHQ